MTEKTHFEIFLAMNEEGDYEVATAEEEASERLVENQGGYQCRIVRIGGFMARPALVETAPIDIPDDAGEIHQIEVQAKPAEDTR
jgi:hypothetical protein